jgi:hypothetical protein
MREILQLRGHYQNGYVTHDVEKAMDIFAERFGLAGLRAFDIDVTVSTPSGDQPMGLRIANGWAGGVNFELMQPVSGYVDPLVSMLPEDRSDPVPRFHHFALRRDDLDAMRAEIAGCGLPIAFAGEPAGMVFAYLDARASLGHFIELVWKEAGGWEKIGWPEGKPML